MGCPADADGRYDPGQVQKIEWQDSVDYFTPNRPLIVCCLPNYRVTTTTAPFVARKASGNFGDKQRRPPDELQWLKDWNYAMFRFKRSMIGPPPVQLIDTSRNFKL
jgi:hypothetical protein